MNEGEQCGFIQRFSRIHGWGFIQADSGEDVFVHVTGIVPGFTPRIDQRVSFSIANGKRGTYAANVRPCDE